jgi:hypothetical protein
MDTHASQETPAQGDWNLANSVFNTSQPIHNVDPALILPYDQSRLPNTFPAPLHPSSSTYGNHAVDTQNTLHQTVAFENPEPQPAFSGASYYLTEYELAEPQSKKHRFAACFRCRLQKKDVSCPTSSGNILGLILE